jgi:hypothetical protein
VIHMRDGAIVGDDRAHAMRREDRADATLGGARAR